MPTLQAELAWVCPLPFLPVTTLPSDKEEGRGESHMSCVGGEGGRELGCELERTEIEGKEREVESCCSW